VLQVTLLRPSLSYLGCYLDFRQGPGQSELYGEIAAT